MIGLIVATLSLAALVAPWYADIPERLTALRSGAHGLKYTPVIFVVLAITGYASLIAAQNIPALQWSPVTIVDGNVLVTAITPGNAASTAPGTALGTVAVTVTVAAFLAVLFLFFVVFNYEEEDWGRDTWGHVVVWGVAHLIMGIPVFAVIPITAAGVVYKLIHDHAPNGFNAAYTAHVTVNTLLVAFLAVTFTLTVTV